MGRRRGGIKITDIKVHALKPFGELNNINGWEKRKNVFSFIQVFTDDGIEGCSISSLTGGTPNTLENSLDMIKKTLVGKDPFDREKIYYELNFPGSNFNKNKYFNSALDFALWDIAGKAFNVPVYKLMGGFRNRVRAYASSLAHSDIDSYLQVIRTAEERGFTAYKIHGFREPKKDIELCEACRAAFPGMDFMMDTMYDFDRASALKVGRVLDKLDFVWYECPIRDDDLEGLRLLRRKLDTPIAAGEVNLLGFPAFSEYITSGAVDILRSFGDHIGGITPMLKAAHLCEAHNLKNELHSYGPTLVEAAHLHVMLAIRNCDFFEAADAEGMFTVGMKDTITVAPDGYVYAPQKPGLGYDVDWDYISDHIERVF